MRSLALASVLLSIFAAPAGAAVTHEVADGTLTVSGDGEANAIALTVEAGEIAVNGRRTGLSAGPLAGIVVNTFAGADAIDASALPATGYAALAVTGGGDNDRFTGGDGGDLLIWNDGDGSDVSTGGLGNDGVQVNGSPAARDVFSYRPDPADDDRVVLTRTDPAPFTLEFEAERMSVNSLGGNDAIAPDPGAPAGIGRRTEPLLDGGEGDDEIAGGGEEAEIHGGEGSDRVSGGAGFNILFGDSGPDVVNGGPGEDFLLGGAGADTVNGGDGRDFMLWIDGDGSDVSDGGAGTDEMGVDGSPVAGDVFSYRRDPDVDGGFLFDRANLNPFTIEFAAELLVVNGGDGDDVIAPVGRPGIPTLLTGGEGDDEITGNDSLDVINGGGGSDLIDGGPERDQLLGDGGPDVIDGGGGDDSLLGGTGNDSIVWNDGDDSDIVLGQAGLDRLQVNGSQAEGDEFELVAELGTTTFRRRNLAPFEIELPSETLPGSERSGGIEIVETNGGGGDDSFTISAGLPHLSVVADGGPGDDVLNGAEEPDEFLGGPGEDTLSAGAGADLLMARDRQPDIVRGGDGEDSAQTDEVTVDAVDGVEHLDATPPPPGPPPPLPPPPLPADRPPAPVQPPAPPAADTVALLPRLGKVALATSGRKLLAKVPVSCPAEEAGGCQTTLTLKTAKPRPGTVIGSKTVGLAPGGRTTASIRVSPRAAALARNGRLAVRLRIASTDSAGNTASRTVAITLDAGRISTFRRPGL